MLGDLHHKIHVKHELQEERADGTEREEVWWVGSSSERQDF